MIHALWHRLVCVPFERNSIRETVDKVLGYRCACGVWAPVVNRPETERAKAIRPAHERYRKRVQKIGIVRRRA